MLYFTLTICWGYFRPKHKNAIFFENHRNPVMLVFIGKLLMSTLRWVPICQGFGHFSAFLHNFVLAKLATSCVRVKEILNTKIVKMFMGATGVPVVPWKCTAYFGYISFIMDRLSFRRYLKERYWSEPNRQQSLNYLVNQGSTLRVNLWPQASKNSQKQLRASKKRPLLVLQAQ